MVLKINTKINKIDQSMKFKPMKNFQLYGTLTLPLKSSIIY